jgi:hypothetical protein
VIVNNLEAFDFAGPSFAAGFFDPGQQVLADIEEALALGWVGAQQRAAQVPLTELTDARIGCRYGSADCDRRASSALSESWSSLRVAA